MAKLKRVMERCEAAEKTQSGEVVVKPKEVVADAKMIFPRRGIRPPMPNMQNRVVMVFDIDGGTAAAST